MSEEWALTELIRRPDCREPILKQYKREIDEIRNYSHLDRCDTNVLAMFLSYVALGDIFACMQTCKRWYEASRRKHFWKRHIDYELRTCAALPGLSFARSAVLTFDTFGHPDRCETLRDQVEWLFRIGWIGIGPAGDASKGVYPDVHITRYTHANMALSFIYNSDTKIIMIRYFSVRHIHSTKATGRTISWYPTREYGLLYSLFAPIDGVIQKGSFGSVIYRYKDGETVTVDNVEARVPGKICDWIDKEMERRKTAK